MPLTWKDSGLRWYWVVVLVFLADQLSKQWVLANFDLFESVKLLPFLISPMYVTMAPHLAS